MWEMGIFLVFAMTGFHCWRTFCKVKLEIPISCLCYCLLSNSEREAFFIFIFLIFYIILERNLVFVGC